MVVTIVYEDLIGYPIGYRLPNGEIRYFKQYVNDMKVLQ